MPRVIEHTAFALRSYADICHILQRDATGVLRTATDAASRRVTVLVRHADEVLPDFDSSENLTVVVGQLEHAGDHHASLEFSWDANRAKRLLANVEARLDVHPLVRRGPSASTELILTASYVPAAGARRSPESALFGRRIVRAALHRLLQKLVEILEEYEESITSSG